MILVLFATVLLVLLFDYFRWGIGANPTPRKISDIILQQLPKNPGPMADLGSGFGHFAYKIACNTKARVTGYEGAIIPYYLSKFFLLLRKSQSINILKSDFFQEDLSKYSIVFCYLYRGAMDRLSVKLQKELKSGSFIISHTFAIRDLKPKKVVYANDLYHTPIYIYQID